MTATTAPVASAVTAPDPFWRRLRLVALWSVLLGVGIELLLIAIVAASAKMPDAAHACAQIAQKVSWSFVVCAGISCGLALNNGRARIMGLLGLLAGPAGFVVARAVHKSALQAMDAAPPGEALSPALLAGLKAVEYGVFGFWLGRITRVETAPLSHYLRAALAIGVVFGTVFIVLFVRARPAATFVDLAPKVLNELFFPLGCAFILFVARKTSLAARAASAA